MRNFWKKEIKPLILWLCLEKHFENLVRAGIDNNGESLRTFSSYIAKICEPIMNEYFDEGGGSDRI